MTRILMVGDDAPLLEGLAQSLAALGHAPTVASTLQEARELAVTQPPLIALVSHEFAAKAGADMLGLALAPGGALLLYRPVGGSVLSLAPSLQRAVLADLTLPLERNRLVALVAHVGERVRTTGRGGMPETTAEA